ncbi:MAG: hypothetical protein SNG20_07325 [Rikenellaceae bacterium]
MKKTIFICGKIYEISANNCVATCKAIQKHINKICNDPDNDHNEDLVTLDIEFTEMRDTGEFDITFTFKRINLFASNGVNPRLVNDSDGQLIMGMDGKFAPPVKWEFVEPFAYGRYNIPIFEFAPAYAGTAEAMGASEIKGMQVESSRDEFKLRIRV